MSEFYKNGLEREDIRRMKLDFLAVQRPLKAASIKSKAILLI
jgi:hypothetical protein